MGCCSAARILLALLLWWLAWPARAEVVEIQAAQARIAIDGRAVPGGPVELPYHWDRLHPGAGGEATFEMAFALPGVSAEPYGLLLHRVGNAYEVWLNGSLLKREGDLELANGADFAQEPRYVEVPPQLLARENRLAVRIRADTGRRGGLSPPLIGPDEELHPRYLQARRQHLAGTLVVALVGIVVGGMAIALWLTQPGGGSLYLYAGLAEWFWALRVSAKLVEQPPLPWPQWNALMVLAIAVWISCVMMFCAIVAGWGRHRAARALRAMLWGMLGTAWWAGWWAVARQQPLVLTLWYGLCMVVAVPVCVLFVAGALRRGASREHRILAAALALNVLVGVRDWLVFRFGGAYSDGTWLRYSGLMFSCMLTYVAIMRFSAASAQVRELSASLAARVAQKEAELAQSYQQVEQLAREQERTRERTRILRDMHDGVGAHISTAIRQLQSGRASHDEVLQTLRDSLDQLKLSIDAMHLPAGDVTALLANLRYRLEPRLRAAGIALEWHVDLLAPVRGVDGPAMRQLQFMLFEVLSNVLQHAQASVLRMEMHSVQEGAVLRVADNGCGFDTQRPVRKGLLSLRERAQAIGAHLTLNSGAGGTEVIIRLPG